MVSNRAVMDQMGRLINVPKYPKRIVSLVPSITHLLADLGLEERVIGVTKFCNDPDHFFRSKTKVGGTKSLNFDVIQALKPDLIIGNKEENVQEQIEQLAQNYPVWMSDVLDFESAIDLVKQIGIIVDKVAISEEFIQEIEANFQDLRYNHEGKKITAAYFIWTNPLMVAGRNTFIHEMMEEAGFENVFGQEVRYPSISEKLLVSRRPAVILLSSEPYPFKEKHISYFKEICPESKIILVDGVYFSWYGSKMRYAGSYFKTVRESLINYT